MEAAQIVQHARCLGITLTIEHRFVVARPKGATPRDLAHAIREHKSELLTLLTATTETDGGGGVDERACHELDTERAAANHVARLDVQRCEADRLAGHEYDFDSSAPSHAEYLERTGQRCVCQIPPAEQRERELDRLACADGWIPPSPAGAIVATCQRYGVALRIDATTGDLVVGKARAKAGEPTQPWATLLVCIEAHLEAVARLVAAGWTIKANFPKTTAA